MISVEEAQAKVLERAEPLGIEAVDLMAGVGRVLAETLIAPHDLPPFDNSAMDGYALRSHDTLAATPGAPLPLRIVGESAAGGGYPCALRASEAVQIHTGAPIPEGADTILPLEQAQIRDGMLVVDTPVRSDMHIRPKGLDVKAGEPLLEAGMRLQTTHMGLLAALGLTPLKVYRRPRVALITTGSELLPYDAPLQPNAIRDSNSVLLRLWLSAWGVPFQFLGIVPDEEKPTRDALEEAVREAEVVLLTGGASVGGRDWVKPALQQLGAETVFWRVKMKPGKPLLFARWQKTAIFGLPGNPLASVVGLLLFVRPYLRALEGETQTLPPCWTARLGAPVQKNETRAEFQTARLTVDGEGVLWATPTPAQGSSLLGSLFRANAFLSLPAGERSYPTGTPVKVFPILPMEGASW